MTEQNKPNEAEQVHVSDGAAGEESSNFQPKIDTNQAGASQAYGEGSIQILEGLEAVRKGLAAAPIGQPRRVQDMLIALPQGSTPQEPSKK